MPDVSLTGVLIVAAVAFAIPLLLGLAPALRLPAVVLEIVAGVVIGPSVLGLVEVDVTLRVLALIGLAFLLFLAGLEIDLERLRGRSLKLAASGFALSLAIAFGIAFALWTVGTIDAPLLVAIVLCATALGIVVPVLVDAGQTRAPLGQIVIAGASIAEFGAIVLLSLFFSREAAGIGARLLLLGAFALLVVATSIALAAAGRLQRLGSILMRLQDTSAQIRVRGAFLLLVGFAVLAQFLGLEVILGAFLAGAILALLDKDRAMTHPAFRGKLEAVGFGVFIPFFFVTSGMELDVRILLQGGSSILLVPVLLLALLLARGAPAALYKPQIGTRGALAAGLLQATSLPFIVAAMEIGQELGVLKPVTGAAFVVAGLLSVMLFPLLALTLLRSTRNPRGTPARREEASAPPGEES